VTWNQHTVSTLKGLLYLALVLGLSACSAKQTYGGLQQGARNDCASAANSTEYARCMERLDMSYEEYEQARREQEEQNR
jgi:hypothetical protein